jgi:1,2-diacylglycerol 3-alpha-glucosyltransferase
VVRADNFPGVSLRSWENIVLVRPEDPGMLAEAVGRLLDDRELAARVAAGQQRLIHEHFTLDLVTEAHIALYERAIAASRPVG